MTSQSYRNFLVTLLICVAFAGYGQQKPVSSAREKIEESVDSLRSEWGSDLTKVVSEIKNLVPDSLPVIKVDSTNLPELPKIDSIGVAYDNGKLVLPDQDIPTFNKELLKTKAEDEVSGLRDPEAVKQAILDYKEKLPSKETVEKGKILFDKKEKHITELEKRSDSLKQLVEKGEDVVNQIREGIADPERIYSNQSLKKIYDSLGISKLDSVLALASSKKEVSKEELLDAINLSFPSSPIEKPVNSPRDLANLPELKSLRDEVSIPDLSSLKISPDLLQELPPIGSFQLPTDSIPMLDSLRKLYLLKEKLKLREQEIRENVKSTLVKEKETFRDKIYFEGILSILKDDQDVDLLQVSPAVGFRIKDNFSIGLGPNIMVSHESEEWKFSMGYRAFSKYEVLSQKAYVQVEDIVEPYTVNREYINRSMHNILAGGGYLLPISQSLAINFCVLYTLNQNSDSEENASPWVVRLGLSSRRKNLK